MVYDGGNREEIVQGSHSTGLWHYERWETEARVGREELHEVIETIRTIKWLNNASWLSYNTN